MKALVAMILALVAAPLLAQTAPTVPPAPKPAEIPLPRVAIVTSVGRIVVELDTRRAPITAGNFLRYVDLKRFDGRRFYRVSKVQEHFGFVQFGMDGDPKLGLPPIKLEPTSQTGIRHLDGTLSNPRLAPGSGRGEFTIMLGDQPAMDADSARPDDANRISLGYAAFGRVVEGMDVLLKIFDAPVSPTATLRGSFRGEIPAAPVTIFTARRLKP